MTSIFSFPARKAMRLSEKRMAARTAGKKVSVRRL